MYGEGNYALSVVKEIVASDSFLNLDEKTKQCQNDESLETCQERNYHNEGIKNCKCIPFSLRNYSIPQVEALF